MAGAEEVEAVRKAIIELDEAHIGELVRKAVSGGASTKDIVEEGMRAGMTEVGRKYEEGEYYLAEFEISAQVMTKGLNVLKLIVPWESGGGETVVLATVKGDLHDMGKVLVGSLLTVSGYKVVDAGVDVAPEKIVDVVRKNGAKAVGLSLVLTQSAVEVGKVVEALKEAGLRDQVKVVIGGVAARQEIADKYGCDAYVQSAFDAVGVLGGLLEKSRSGPV
jgi:methylmalonyl-CoA mutase cobalamin-binding domain/chain